MSSHLLTNFEIQKYHQNEPKFNGVYSRNNLSKIKIKDGTYIMNLKEYESIGHNEFVLVNNVLKEFYDMKEEIKNSNNK